MAAKKYYAVKKGKITGVFESWEECKGSVDGFPGAQYKGFAVLAQARAYLGESGNEYAAVDDVHEAEKSSGKASCHGKNQQKKSMPFRRQHEECLPEPGQLLAYVDGSYDDALGKYAFGCVFILSDGRIYTEYGNGDNPESKKLHNVTGEMLGAMFATMFAIKNKFAGVEIRYDYQGIEKWVTGEWKAKTELTQKYARTMQRWSGLLAIQFTKVPAHSNVEYNELADKLAKTGLIKGNGVPGTRLIEEMEPYNGTDSLE